MKTKAAPTLEAIYAPVERELQVVPETILHILSTPNELARDVIRYFFSGRGKLLRPALTLLGAGMKGWAPALESRLIRLAASFEIFHAATLIHDDIIDSAYLRRNLPTINVKWNSEVAVLVGDYLHDKAIGTILENGTPEILASFLKAAGTVCDGEIHELKEKGNFDLSEAEYFEIIRKKTASLLALTLEAGGMLAGASEEEVRSLGRFGMNFGMAFQIVDDCLDFTGNEHEFGKTLGADCFAGVLTLPLIRLLACLEKGTKKETIRLFRSDGSGRFGMLLDRIRENRTIETSLETAAEFSGAARRELTRFEDSPAKRSLERLADYVLERSK